jgi:hypothetical protein
LPPKKRTVIRLAWINALSIPFVAFWASLAALYTQLYNMLNVTIAADDLQAHLRSKYPGTSVGNIYIDTYYTNLKLHHSWHPKERAYEVDYAAGTGIVYSWHPSEGSYATETLPEYHLSELQPQFDYTIIIPTSLTSSLNNIIGEVNKYKPAGKRFTTQILNRP